MKSVYAQEAVRKAYWVDGKSQRQIARELGLSRNTVSRLLQTKAGENRRYSLQKTRVKPALEAYPAWIQAILEADEQAPRKQRHTGQRIYERVKQSLAKAVLAD